MGHREDNGRRTAQAYRRRLEAMERFEYIYPCKGPPRRVWATWVPASSTIRSAVPGCSSPCPCHRRTASPSIAWTACSTARTTWTGAPNSSTCSGTRDPRGLQKTHKHNINNKNGPTCLLDTTCWPKHAPNKTQCRNDTD